MAEKTTGNNMIFALDIGTRSVIGVVAEVQNGLLCVKEVVEKEHTVRAVVDGQIEDITSTALLAAEVKTALEEKNGCKFTQVHVAAAGRVLKTQKVVYKLARKDNSPVETAEVYKLESLAIQAAYENMLQQLENGAENLNFYCVGHSVIGYYLDDYKLASLLEHKGKNLKIELVASFLPGAVVESLYVTMQKIGLNVASVILEPIAAINMVIPKELRLLNLALVDIGAGTSDIAVSAGGSVSAYTMATTAGDEITEAIMHELVTDFAQAEIIKFKLGRSKKAIEYKNVLGLKFKIMPTELLERIKPAIEELAQVIAQKIKDVNLSAPAAVFLVGGGSKTPMLKDFVAKKLGLEPEKIAVGGSNYIKQLVNCEEKYTQPQYATPLGIALTASQNMQENNFNVAVNGREVYLNGGGSTGVDVLLKVGYTYENIMGRSGKSIVYELDGKKRTIRGGLPRLAVLKINGKTAGLTTGVNCGDNIEFTPAVNGTDAVGDIENIISPYTQFEIEVEGKPFKVGAMAWVNGGALKPGQQIAEMDKLSTTIIYTVQDLINNVDCPAGKIPQINGRAVEDYKQKLLAGDKVSFVVQAPAPKKAVQSGGAAPKPGIEIILNGKPTTLIHKEENDYFFYDILTYMDIDTKNLNNAVTITKNGKEASYTECLEEGDRVEVIF